MKMIVKPQEDVIVDKWCPENHTMCCLCSEDPRWCW